MALQGTTATCERHTELVGLPDAEPTCRQCDIGDLYVHPVWTIRHGEPLCIFHAVDNALRDDMNEHSAFESIYEQLRQAGHPEAY